MKKVLIITGIVSLLLLCNISVDASIDQVQDIGQDKWCFSVFGNQWGAQSFIPTKNILTKVQLLLKLVGEPDDITPIELSISDELPDNEYDNSNFLTTVSVNSNKINYTAKWIDFDFEDIQITPGDTYYIILRTEGGSHDTGVFYEWLYGRWTEYTNGRLYITYDECQNWQETAEDDDFTFKTWGYDPPRIEKKVQDPLTGNWVDEAYVLGFHENLNFSITIFNDNDDDDDFKNLVVVDELPNFLTYNHDSTKNTAYASSHIIGWNIDIIDNNNFWQVKYSTFVENDFSGDTIEGYNHVNLTIESPPCKENKDIKKEKTVNNFLNNLYNRIQKRPLIKKILNLFISKFLDPIFQKNNINPLITSANTNPFQYSDKVFIQAVKNKPDLICSGDIAPDDRYKEGGKIKESFNLKNNGAPDSKLDWRYYTPRELISENESKMIVTSGIVGKQNDVTPEDGWLEIFVHMTIDSIETKGETYYAELLIYNKYNPEDNWRIMVKIETGDGEGVNN